MSPQRLQRADDVCRVSCDGFCSASHALKFVCSSRLSEVAARGERAPNNSKIKSELSVKSFCRSILYDSTEEMSEIGGTNYPSGSCPSALDYFKTRAVTQPKNNREEKSATAQYLGQRCFWSLDRAPRVHPPRHPGTHEKAPGSPWG